MTAVMPPPTDVPSGPDSGRPFDEELIIKEARGRQRRRWLVAGVVLVLMTVTGLLIAAEAFGGQGKTGKSPSTDDGTSRSVPPVKGADVGSTPVGLGAGTPSIYFLNSQQGWIATGCGSLCYQSRPAIVQTSNGGRTWRVIVGPDIGSVPFSGPTWMELGGKTEVGFIDARRGFYAQVGELWTTDDGGSTWSLVKTGGPVVSFTTLGNSAWALVSHCPRFPLSCSQLDLYRWSALSQEWVRLSRSFSSGGADPTDVNMTVAGLALFMSVPGHQYRIAASGRVTSVSTACRAMQELPTPGQLVGICDVDGGGDASKVKFAISTNQGKTWTPTVAGPPSQSDYNWSGEATANGKGIIWYVVGGSTLWRTSTNKKEWTPVHATQAGSEEELFPVVFASPSVGFMGESGNESVRLLKTSDGGLTWVPVSGLPVGSRLEPPSGR